jgi:hypothetical protein
MLSTKTGKKQGFLVTWVKNSNLKDYYEGNCLFIGFIITSPTGNGYGEKLQILQNSLVKKTSAMDISNYGQMEVSCPKMSPIFSTEKMVSLR